MWVELIHKVYNGNQNKVYNGNQNGQLFEV